MTEPCPECGATDLVVQPEKRNGVAPASATADLFASTPASGADGGIAELVMLCVGVVIDVIGFILRLFSRRPKPVQPEPMVLYCPKCGYWKPL